MYTGLNHLHSSLRYVILIVLVAVIVRAMLKWSKNESFTKQDNLYSVIALGIVHLQFLLGLIMYFMSPYMTFLKENGMGEVMKSSLHRFYIVEHLVGMLIGVVVVTVGRSLLKRATLDAEKHKKLFTYYGIGLLIIILSIPWPFRGLGNGWF
jgi:membrane protein DedA with SNARE-associated domain